MQRTTGTTFAGFASTTTTPIPDEFFDVLAPQLGEAELRVLIYIFRRTFGFKKYQDTISLRQLVAGIRRRDGRQLDHGAGVAKSAAARAVRSLVAKGVISVRRNRSAERGDEPTTYTLRFRDAPVSSNETPGSSARGQGGVLDEDTQETGIQDTDQQETVLISKETNSTGFHSNRSSARLSTPLREQSIVDNRNGAGPPGDHAGQPPPSTGLHAIRAVLHDHGLLSADRVADQTAGGGTPRGRPPKAPAPVVELIEQLTYQLHDDAKNLRANITRAARLWKASGLPPDKFYQRLLEAKSITRQQSTVTKKASDGHGTLNRMPYYFAVVEDVVGLRPQGRPA